MRLRRPAIHCAVCQGRIKKHDDILPMNGSFYHPNCLLHCADCHGRAGHPFASSNRILFLCDRDFAKRIENSQFSLTQSTETCVGCKRRILSDPVHIEKINLVAESWHPSCFRIFTEWNVRVSTFLGGKTLISHKTDKAWQDYIEFVWETMKNFQTVVADHRVSLKGYLSSSFVQPAMKVGPRLMSQLHTLLSIVEELESHYPMFSLSSEVQHSKSILSRLISKFNQLCIIAKSNAGALRPFDVNQTAILIEMSRDAIHYLIRMCVGFFLRLDPCIEDFCRESLLNVSSELENGNAFPWNVTKTDLPPRKPLSVTASSRATTVGDCGRRTAPQKDTLRRGDPFKCYRSKEEEDCLSTDMLSEIDGEKDLLNNISLDGKGRDKATLDRISRLLRGVSVEKSKRRPTILIGDTIHSGDSCNDSSVSPLPAWALPKVFANEIRELTFSKRQLC